MIVKTESLILRVLPYSRTSLMADCLTRDLGRVWLLAKGAQRPKSQFLYGQSAFKPKAAYLFPHGGLQIFIHVPSGNIDKFY